MGGSSADVLADVERFRDAGCSHIALNFWEGDANVFRARIKGFAADVLPGFNRFDLGRRHRGERIG
jgi:hypothetical protein